MHIVAEPTGRKMKPSIPRDRPTSLGRGVNVDRERERARSRPWKCLSQYCRWTDDETNRFVAGIQCYGQKWCRIRDKFFPDDQSHTNINVRLKDRFRTILKRPDSVRRSS